jgi:hypothetical protein
MTPGAAELAFLVDQFMAATKTIPPMFARGLGPLDRTGIVSRLNLRLIGLSHAPKQNSHQTKYSQIKAKFPTMKRLISAGCS